MDAVTLTDLLAEGEGPRLEFKREFTTELGRDLVAFANGEGGLLLLGVDDDASVIGLTEDLRSVEDRVMGLAANTVAPSLVPRVETVDCDGVPVMALHVAVGPQKPYTANGVCYVRAGSTSRRALPDELRRLSLDSDYTAYERTPVRDAAFEDLNLVALERFIEEWSPGALDVNGVRLSDAAASLHIVAKGGELVTPTVAGLLAFGRKPQALRPEWGISAVRVAGADLADPILDRADPEGPVSALTEAAMAFVSRNLRVAAAFDDSATRRDVPEYPVAAVREILTNALAHRDYSAPGRVAVRMFEDRLEVANPGRLPGQVDLGELLERGGSYPRNPSLCRLMRGLRLVEEIGRGLLRVRREMRELGSDPPRFEQTAIGFLATLPSRHSLKHGR